MRICLFCLYYCCWFKQKLSLKKKSKPKDNLNNVKLNVF